MRQGQERDMVAETDAENVEEVSCENEVVAMTIGFQGDPWGSANISCGAA